MDAFESVVGVRRLVPHEEWTLSWRIRATSIGGRQAHPRIGWGSAGVVTLR
ncbi:hypothetical protein ACFSM7_12260 [Clavibacter michiganensis subsp. tessellarius]|uniref:hypothetical protein n=1 Tax=Clavibacter tessellarius TaxID=31965 RepID=UPI00363EA85D